MEQNPQILDKIDASGGTPHELFYDELCGEWGPEAVDYVQRCFYLRMWKQVHGTYPCPLDYVRMRALMALEEEYNLRQAYEMYKSHEMNKRNEGAMRQQHFAGGHVTPNVHRNIF